MKLEPSCLKGDSSFKVKENFNKLINNVMNYNYKKPIQNVKTASNKSIQNVKTTMTRYYFHIFLFIFALIIISAGSFSLIISEKSVTQDNDNKNENENKNLHIFVGLFYLFSGIYFIMIIISNSTTINNSYPNHLITTFLIIWFLWSLNYYITVKIRVSNDVERVQTFLNSVICMMLFFFPIIIDEKIIIYFSYSLVFVLFFQSFFLLISKRGYFDEKNYDVDAVEGGRDIFQDFINKESDEEKEKNEIKKIFIILNTIIFSFSILMIIGIIRFCVYTNKLKNRRIFLVFIMIISLMGLITFSGIFASRNLFFMEGDDMEIKNNINLEKYSSKILEPIRMVYINKNMIKNLKISNESVLSFCYKKIPDSADDETNLLFSGYGAMGGNIACFAYRGSGRCYVLYNNKIIKNWGDDDNGNNVDFYSFTHNFYDHFDIEGLGGLIFEDTINLEFAKDRGIKYILFYDKINLLYNVFNIIFTTYFMFVVLILSYYFLIKTKKQKFTMISIYVAFFMVVLIFGGSLTTGV